MNKLVVGLAAVFAVMVLISVSFNTFKTAKENADAELTRYNSPIDVNRNTTETNNTNEENASGLKTFTNTEYDYSFKYPEEIFVSCSKAGTPTSEAPKICLYFWKTGDGPGEAPTMYIDVRDEDLFAERYEDTLELNLRDYADHIWQINKDGENSNKDVSDLKRIKIGGRNAYKFTTTYSLKTDTGSTRIEDELVVILVDTKDMVKLLITYPEDEDTLEDVLDTFAFL